MQAAWQSHPGERAKLFNVRTCLHPRNIETKTSSNVDNDENNSNDDVSAGGDGRSDGKGVVRFEYAQRIHYASQEQKREQLQGIRMINQSLEICTFLYQLYFSAFNKQPISSSSQLNLSLTVMLIIGTRRKFQTLDLISLGRVERVAKSCFIAADCFDDPDLDVLNCFFNGCIKP